MDSVNRKVGLRADSSHFTLDGNVFRILGGSMHYFRVPRAYWRERLLQMKACGVNTLTTYVPWNLHEPERGLFCFDGQLDLVSYISEAAQLGLWVILRPGPYICSEWELGGLPSWLLRDGNMKLRTTYPGFTQAVSSFFTQLFPRVVPLQYTKGGPIIAFQVENEYGSYAKDGRYMSFVKEDMLSHGVCELLLTSDNQEGLKCGGVSGALKTINLQKLTVGLMKHLEDLQPLKPKMVTEFWTGWFDVWGEKHHVFDAEKMVATVSWILSEGMSVNMYMFHGGTSFGFMNGAVDLGTYKPQISSYDYDAPLSEAGDYTKKYHLLRALFSEYHSESLPEVPPVREKRAYGSVVVTQQLSLWDSLQHAQVCKSVSPVSMENLPVNNDNGQSYGYVLYETIASRGGVLNSKKNIRDRALVFVDRHFIGILDHKVQQLIVPDGKGPQTLDLLVENCGRVNYGPALDNQQKGLIGDIYLNNSPLKDFTVYSLEMKPEFIGKLSAASWAPLSPKPRLPGFFQGELHVDGPPCDTFLKLPGWNKGVAFINGQNLGRYWYVGPQQTLYVPAPWLQKGDNQVVLFEEVAAGAEMRFTDFPDLGKTSSIRSAICSLS